jgi:FkbM family methyltransferase
MNTNHIRRSSPQPATWFFCGVLASAVLFVTLDPVSWFNSTTKSCAIESPSQRLLIAELKSSVKGYQDELSNGNSELARIRTNYAKLQTEVQACQSARQACLLKLSTSSKAQREDASITLGVEDGGVGVSLGPVGVFPRARPRIIHNVLWGLTGCSDKAAYVRGWGGQAVVVEVGAYHGEEIPQFKGLVKRLYTYEPSAPKLPLIRNTIATAGMENVVTVRPVAASSKSGTAILQLAKSEGTQQDSLGEIGFMTKDNPSRKNVTIETVRLDEEIFERIHLLKVDTQGHELAVLQGAEGIMKKYGVDVIHIEFSPALMRGHNVDPTEYLEYLWSWGYTCSYCRDNFNLPDSELPKVENVWSWKAFTDGFGELHEIPGHGAWGDLLCI